MEQLLERNLADLDTMLPIRILHTDGLWRVNLRHASVIYVTASVYPST